MTPHTMPFSGVVNDGMIWIMLGITHPLCSDWPDRLLRHIPYTTNAGQNAHVRVRRGDNADVQMVWTWGAHERVAVRRGEALQ
jgi:hypothetical protein